MLSDAEKITAYKRQLEANIETLEKAQARIRELESANAYLEEQRRQALDTLTVRTREAYEEQCQRKALEKRLKTLSALIQDEIRELREELTESRRDRDEARGGYDQLKQRAEARQTCAEEGCAAPSEEMRALDTLTVRTREEEPVIEECRALDEEYVCPHCGQRDELCWRGCWRCICGAPEDESGYRPAGEVERG